MPKTKVEVYDKDQLIYPFIESDHVTFSNGMKITEMLDQSISMPKVTHEDSSFKVGVGDQDVSSSIVDSSVADMTIKGQTYQNILPEPSLRNKMIGKSMQRLNEGYDSIEAVDGVSKSAILKGQTLVNVDSYYSKDDFVDRHILNLTDDGWVEMVANGNYRNAFTRFNGMIKPNTKYLAVVEVKENTLVNETLPERPFYLFTNFSNSDGEVVVPFVDQTRWISQGQKGLFKYILTSRGDLSTTTINLRNFVSNTTTSGRIIYRTMLIEYVEGMENWDIPFFRGIQYVKMPVLTTTGKNLFELPQSDKMLKGSIGKYIKLNLKPNTNYTYNSILDKKGNTAEFDFYGWISNDTNSNFTGYEVFHWKLNKTFSKTFNTGNDEWYFHVYGEQKGDDYRNYLINFQLEQGTVATSYEPYKTNILHTPEEMVLKGLGDVQDTLNVNTGEYVQRVKEVIYTGEEDGWSSSQMLETPNNISFYIPLDNHLDNTNNPTMRELVKDNLGFTNNCRSATVNEPSLDGKKGFSIHNNGNVYFTIPTSECANLDAWKSRLRTQPLVLQYPVKNPIIKTVDLSSHGNWEKVILDGSDSITYGANWNDIGTAYYTNLHFDHPHVFSDRMTKTEGWNFTKPDHSFALRENNKKYQLVLVVHHQHTNGGNNVQGLKQYLSQNPITFWYQTTTTQDNSIREMLSFANGHLQVSSEAENSLLPSVQYEIPTKNSYHMDLMKTNTLYTMKAKSVSGTFTIDGTSYNVNTNGTFTSPSSMTDKLLIMSNKTNEEVMLLEGNVIDKTIPYFKGIKSTFEGEDKIEVLSVGKNLANIATQGETNFNIGYIEKGVTYSLKINRDAQVTYNLVLKPHLNSDANQTRIASGITENFIVFTSPSNGYLFFNGYSRVIVSDIILTRGEYTSQTMPSFEPYITNTTKIPLLSPLRSLPNGVCDELVIDRLNHKAKLIQRVGELVLNGNEEWTQSQIRDKHYIVMLRHCSEVGIPEKYPSTLLCSRFINQQPYGYDREGINVHANYNFHIGFLKNRLLDASVNSCKKWLSQNPTTVLYELNTPIITEIDLEGYPYAYKDGHIFLNSDIAPTTQITYSINQAQQIESANENLQRHEKEISHLQKLIAQYIQVEYESTLLSLKI